MNNLKKPSRVEYICTSCGKKEVKSAVFGRPAPGSCPRKSKTPDGKPRPHSWVKNRDIP